MSLYDMEIVQRMLHGQPLVEESPQADPMDAAFDAVTIEYPALKPYFRKLDENKRLNEVFRRSYQRKNIQGPAACARKVIREYVEKEMMNKKYSLTIKKGGKVEKLSIGVFSSLKTEPSQRLLGLPFDQLYTTAKRILIALHQADKVLMGGLKTLPIPSDNEHLKTNMKPKHAGAKWIYSLSFLWDLGDKGTKFPAIGQIMLPSPGKNQFYQMNVEGTVSFKKRKDALNGNFAKKGEVEIDLYE